MVNPAKEKQEEEIGAVTFKDLQLNHFKALYETSRRLKFLFFGFLLLLLGKFVIFAVDLGSIYSYYFLNSYREYPWAKHVYAASVGLDLILLVWEAWNARKVHKTGDISYIFTNRMALTYNMLTSKARFALYKTLTKARTRLDVLALFLYHQLRNWKRFVFVLTPRRIVNILYIVTFFRSNGFTIFLNKSVDLSLLFSIFQATVYSVNAILMMLAVIGFIWLNLTLLRNGKGSDSTTSEIYQDQDYQEDENSGSTNLKAFCITLMDMRLSKILREYGYAVPSSKPDTNSIYYEFAKPVQKDDLEQKLDVPNNTPNYKFAHPRKVSFRRPNKRNSVMALE